MVVIKYKKIEEGIFFSHLNMLRLWNRLVSIGGVTVKYSEGFNKTRRLYFSSPTRVGIESNCEYIVIDTEESAKVVKEKLINLLPSWLEILSAVDVEKKFNIASLNSRAKYIVSFDGLKSKKAKIEKFFEKESIVVPVISHGEEKQVDIKNRLYDISFSDKGIEIIAGVGNESVRIDEVIKLLLKELKFPEYEWKIIKEKLYLTNEDGEIEEVDENLDKLKRD